MEYLKICVLNNNLFIVLLIHKIMAIGLTLIFLIVIIIGIWLIIEVKRLKHKVFAIFLILLILFSYLSFAVVIKGKDIDLKTVGGWKTATKLYYSWLVNAFHNVKAVTSYASKQDWKNVSVSNSTKVKNKTLTNKTSDIDIWSKI